MEWLGKLYRSRKRIKQRQGRRAIFRKDSKRDHKRGHFDEKKERVFL